MKKLLFVGLAVFLVLVLAGPAQAAPGGAHLNWGSELNPSKCPGGKLVINVTQKVTQDADSGVAGNAWAFDKYNRHIQVWQVSPTTFCAIVKYQGSFVTNAGPSPQNTDTDGIAEGIKGTFQGGYRSNVFTGTLNPNPAYRTKGNIGKFNYQCDVNFNCPGRVNWLDVYFTTYPDFTMDWWGWIYHGGKNGTWVNSSGGNQGDITD